MDRSFLFEAAVVHVLLLKLFLTTMSGRRSGQPPLQAQLGLHSRGGGAGEDSDGGRSSVAGDRGKKQRGPSSHRSGVKLQGIWDGQPLLQRSCPQSTQVVAPEVYSLPGLFSSLKFKLMALVLSRENLVLST